MKNHSKVGRLLDIVGVPHALRLCSHSQPSRIEGLLMNEDGVKANVIQKKLSDEYRHSTG
jgi:hypothetical protein